MLADIYNIFFFFLSIALFSLPENGQDMRTLPVSLGQKPAHRAWAAFVYCLSPDRLLQVTALLPLLRFSSLHPAGKGNQERRFP